MPFEPTTTPNSETPDSEMTLDMDIYLRKALDSDSDGVCDYVDNCLYVFNPKQEDKNKNGIGDVCEPKKRPRKKVVKKP